VAVNPANPGNLIGVFQQDRWSNGGARGLMTAVSMNGGTSWIEPAPPHFSKCAGGTAANGGDYDRASDPWVSIGPDGTVYGSALVFDANTPRNGVAAPTSYDGGRTWRNTQLVIADTELAFFNDKNSVTADPVRVGSAYQVWSTARRRCRSPGTSGVPGARRG
jgi:hypothetical protein